ncbi:MAG: right-handed parallel beta-helix repeat-containing protein [Actinophytocola sp.]|nr:right-handed parallel beta-helix repeat-containing protein [Actinophytocola sp.]
MANRSAPPQRAPMVAALLAALVLTGCTTTPAPDPRPVTTPLTSDVAEVCDNTTPGPTTQPRGSIAVDPAVDSDLIAKTAANPAGSTFWLRPGRHTLGTGQYSQVESKPGNTYLGAPGAILDGRGKNNYAITGDAANVTIRHLVIRGFTAPNNEGVVNHNSANGWIIEHSTIEQNRGAGLMAGARQRVRHNCLRDNGQYGMNAYQPGDGIDDLVVEGNEITGNNTDDWETHKPGCGCTGGVKFWAVDGAVIRDNWVHGNHGPGLWADTNNNDFLIEGNFIDRNADEAIIYEISYNAVIRNNTIRENNVGASKALAESGDTFPHAAIYISESGGEPRVPAGTDRIDIYRNVLVNNWSGITLWENADRFCNSPVSPTGDCTLLVDAPERCTQPAIASAPLYDDCRWKTQRVDVHDNEFVFDPDVLGCADLPCGRMAVLANEGSEPAWSPYRGDLVKLAITQQQNRWHDNSYRGPWKFVAKGTDTVLDHHGWQAAPHAQDTDSTFAPQGGS